MAHPVAATPYGRLQGRSLDHGIARFLGVPYAAAPVGALRLRSPRPLAPWSGTRDAARPAPASLQTLGGNQTWLNEPIAAQSEDCLYLNVWTPAVAGRRPVLVWLHGGQTRNGHGASPAIDGAALAATGIVVVTLNYRLGALGGLAHPALQDEASGLCANWGLQDKLAALSWVAECIACFGGDPACVTLGGQSSGAANAVLVAQHGLGRGRYRAVIAQSPPLFRPPMFADLDDAAAYTEALAGRLGVGVAGLRAVDGAALQQAEHAFAQSPELVARMGRPRTAPVRDGQLLRAWPYDGAVVPLPVLAGWTRTEADFWFDLRDGHGVSIAPLQAPRTPDELSARLAALITQHYAFEGPPSPSAVAAAYATSGGVAQVWRDAYTDLVFRAPILRLLGRQADAGQPVWGFEFAFPLPGDAQSSPHASDVPFVFGTHRHPHLACKIGSAPAVQALSAAMMDAWSSFVRTGSPATGAGAPWPAFDARAPRVMRFGPQRPEPTGLERPQGLACWPAFA